MKAKTMTITGLAVIVVLLITTAIAFTLNSRNKRSLNKEQNQNESLVTQKLQVSQDLDKTKKDLEALTSKEEITNKALKDADSRITGLDKRIAYLSRENSSLLKDKQELAQLQKSKMELDKEYGDLKMEHAAALLRIKDLEGSATALETEKDDLRTRLENAEKYRTDNIEVYGSRGNKRDRLTFVARRTKKLNLSFDAPMALNGPIDFKIMTPAGESIMADNKSSSWPVIDMSPRNMTASSSSVSGIPETMRKIAIRDNSGEKLKPGVYEIQLINNDKVIGNCRLRLR